MIRWPIRKRVPYLGLLLAFALILSYVEVLLPLGTGIPGVKPGLSNFAVLLCLYLFSPADALVLTVSKACLSCLLFGNMTMLLYSLSGAVVSCLVMTAARKVLKLHLPVVSMCGGIFHNLAQFAVALLIMQTKGLFFYLPVLAASGLLTGAILGSLAALVLPKIKKILYKGESV